MAFVGIVFAAFTSSFLLKRPLPFSMQIGQRAKRRQLRSGHYHRHLQPVPPLSTFTSYAQDVCRLCPNILILRYPIFFMANSSSNMYPLIPRGYKGTISDGWRLTALLLSPPPPVGRNTPIDSLTTYRVLALSHYVFGNTVMTA